MKSATLILIAAFAFTGSGCSHQSRQERAYSKYLRKSSVSRQKIQKKFKSGKPQMPITPKPSDPIESTQTGPQAVPADSSR